MKAAISFANFIILFSFLLIACQNPLELSPENTGSFSLAVTGGRTILPETPALADFAVYELAFTATSGGADLTADRTNAALATNPVILVAGTYNLTVSGYKDAAKTRLLAQGTASGIVISAGGNTAKSVVLTPLLGETGTSGDFSWDITIDATAVTVSAAAITIKDSGGEQAGAVETLNTTGQTTGSRTLDSGVYTVAVTLNGAENGVPMAVVYNEILYVYAGLTSRFPSSGTFTFDDSHFHNTHWNITFSQNYEDGGSAVQSVLHGLYTVTDTPVRSGYSFDGWDTAADGSGTRYMPGDDILVSAHMTLYAQWFNYIEHLRAQLAALDTGTADSPATLTLLAAEFSTGTTVPDGAIGWGEIIAEITSAGKFVVLDLSACAFTGNAITGQNSTSPSGNYMNSIKSVTCITGIMLPGSVTSISGYAFYGCSALTRLDIPDSVTRIETYAFRDCTGLSGALVIPDSVTALRSYAFYGCTGFTSVDISDSIKSIDAYVFYGCTGLESIDIPAGVTSIGANAFQKCTSLTGITIPEGIKSISIYLFAGCTGLESITIPSQVTGIGTSAFNGCTALESVDIPDSVTTIGDEAFKGCSSLSGITIPSGVTKIGRNAFQNCTSLTGSITIPSGVTTIAKYVFDGCTALENVDIPDSVTSIDNWAFRGCTSLSSISFPSNLATIGAEAFKDCTSLSGALTIPGSVTSIGGKAFQGCRGLSGALTIPDGITSIEYNVFDYCTGFTSVDIPDSVTSIGSYAFYCCSGLSGELTIPESVTTIGAYAFQMCSGLTGVTIPDSVTSLGEYAFYSCSGLTSLTLSSNLKTIKTNTFRACSGLTSVTIPASVISMEASAFRDPYVDSANTIISVTFEAAGVTFTSAFPGQPQLSSAYEEGGAGTYVRSGTTAFDWTKQPYNTVLTAQLDALPVGAIDSPATVKLAPAVFTTAATVPDGVIGWGEITAVVKNAQKFVRLDLSNITFEGNTITGTNMNTGNDMNTARDFYIKGIILPDTLETIGESAFMFCAYFSGDLIIPGSVTSIGERAFQGCTTLKGALTIPGSVTSIGDYAFMNCYGFTSVTIPDSVTSIGTYAFYNCSKLAGALAIPGSVTSIEANSFMNCSALASVTIPGSVTTIADSAFVGCSSLTSVSFGADGVTIGVTDTFIDAANTTALTDAYTAGGAGTYTRSDTTATDWTKQ